MALLSTRKSVNLNPIRRTKKPSIAQPGLFLCPFLLHSDLDVALKDHVHGREVGVWVMETTSKIYFGGSARPLSDVQTVGLNHCRWRESEVNHLK